MKEKKITGFDFDSLGDMIAINAYSNIANKKEKCTFAYIKKLWYTNGGYITEQIIPTQLGTGKCIRLYQDIGLYGEFLLIPARIKRDLLKRCWRTSQTSPATNHSIAR